MSQHPAKLRRPKLLWTVPLAILVAVSGLTIGSRLQSSPAAHADTASAAHDPNMPGPGGTKNVPTLTATPITPANPNVPGTVPVAWAVKYGKETGIDPRTLLAILLDEGYGFAHGAPADGLRWIWDAWITHKPEGPSLGVTSVKQSTFNEVKALHFQEFSTVSFQDLSWNPQLAMHVLAWKLSDLENGRDLKQALPDHWNPAYNREQLFALAWNGGMSTALDYVSGRPVPDKGKLDTYLDHFNQSWPGADQAINCGNIYTCDI
jgi:hypothetical protein